LLLPMKNVTNQSHWRTHQQIRCRIRTNKKIVRSLAAIIECKAERKNRNRY
jgi:hypothetical protein